MWLGALCAQPALAQRADKARVVVRPFSGPSSARVRDAVVKALEKTKRYELVPNDRVEQAADEIDADLASEAGRAAVGRELGLAGFVSGSVDKSGRQFVLELQVHGGASGALSDEKTFRARKPAALVGQVKRRLPQQLRRTPLALEQPAQAQREPPPAPAPQPEPEAQAAAEDEAEPEAQAESEPAAAPERERTREEDERRRAARAAAAADAYAEAEEAAEEGAADMTALELTLGPRLLMRSFTYDAPATHLPEHSVSPTPAGRVQLRWYPGAHATQDGVAAHLGLELYAQLMLPVEATDGPSVFETKSQAFGGNLRGRIPLRPSEIGIHAGYGAHNVAIGDSQFGGDPEVPSVGYRFLCFGADARIALSERFALSLAASYLHLLDFGEIAERGWFPRVSGAGVQGQLGAGYGLGGPFWIEADLGIVRYFLTFDVDPAAAAAPGARVAEGATDQNLFGTLAIALRL